jgi:hypothetical protein
MDEIKTKKCVGCNKIKPIDAFGKHMATKDGLRHRCRSCRRLESKDYRENNLDKIKESKSRRYRANLAKMKESKKEEYQRNIETYKQYNLKNKDRIKNRNKLSIAKFSKKVALFLGGKCEICGLETVYWEVYDCHHRHPEEKKYKISDLHDKDWESITIPELRKCSLLCRNCHNFLRWRDNRSKSDRTPQQVDHQNHFDKYKDKCVSYLGQKCQICGLKTDARAKYDFHHVGPIIKVYNIGCIIFKDWDTILKPELDKCALLCGNCHRSFHFGRFNDITLIAGPIKQT